MACASQDCRKHNDHRLPHSDLPRANTETELISNVPLLLASVFATGDVCSNPSTAGVKWGEYGVGWGWGREGWQGCSYMGFCVFACALTLQSLPEKCQAVVFQYCCGGGGGGGGNSENIFALLYFRLLTRIYAYECTELGVQIYEV